MIEYTLRDVTDHAKQGPWPNLRQVEQDLLLCLAMNALFSDKFLREQVAMRGGTLLHKVHLDPASRYSEDIDLVVFGDRPEDHIDKAIKRVLTPVLGRPIVHPAAFVKLAIRNAVKPSKIMRHTYRIKSVADPNGLPLIIEVETNVSERTPYLGIQQLPFTFLFQGQTQTATINGFDIHEMLGTKMRALFQRKRGRDLFDLYWALAAANGAVAPNQIIQAFLHYMKQEGSSAEREEFEKALAERLNDQGFLKDMGPLLRIGVTYDPIAAGALVEASLLSLLP